MRIVQLAGSAEWAGGERHILDLLGGLDRSRFETRVLTPEAGPLVARLEGLGVPVRVVELGLADPRGAYRLAGALRDWSPDLVQAHGARSNFYARLACWRLGVPNVSTVHNSLFDYPLPAWRRRAYLAADRLFCGLSAAVVCVSESLRRDLVSREGMPPGLVSVIPNGVDLGRFDPARADRSKLRRELGFPAGSWLVGVAGRMTPQKGHAVFLEAFSFLRRSLPEARAVLVGDGPLRPELEARCLALGLEKDVRFLGVREDMPDVLSGLDLLALPSLSEGLPYAVLEALAMERPVAASAVNGVPEILEKGCGLLVPPGDPAALAGAMAKALSEPAALAAMARAGRAKVLERYSLKGMVERWSALYEEKAG